MFRDLPRYDRYAANNSPWLGELPAHWKTGRMKSMLVERVEKGYPDEPLLAATQSHGVIRKADYGTRTVTASKDLHLLKLVEVGDFVISLRSFQGGIERCYHRGIISPAYTVLTTRTAGYRDYLTYLFKSQPFINSLTLAVTGIREGQNIDYSTLAVDLLPVPPVDEQAAAVKYLAHANARIDKAIAAKRQLVSLLAEENRSFTAHLVTAGLGHRVLDSDVVLPEGWQVLPFLRTVIERADYRGATPEKTEAGITLVTAKNVRSGWIDYGASKEYVSEADYPRIMRRGLPRVGDLLLTMEAPLGNVALVDREDIALAQRVVRFRLDDELLRPQFASAAMNSSYFQHQLMVRSTGSTAAGIKASKLPQLLIALPPIGVQDRLLDMLEQKIGSSTAAVSRARREIALLQEFHTRLVADVVTGQVDVRAIAATLPDVPESFDNRGVELDDELEEALVGIGE